MPPPDASASGCNRRATAYSVTQVIRINETRSNRLPTSRWRTGANPNRPGRQAPQYGQLGSLMPINLPQWAQTNDPCVWRMGKGTPEHVEGRGSSVVGRESPRGLDSAGRRRLFYRREGEPWRNGAPRSPGPVVRSPCRHLPGMTSQGSPSEVRPPHPVNRDWANPFKSSPRRHTGGSARAPIARVAPSRGRGSRVESRGRGSVVEGREPGTVVRRRAGSTRSRGRTRP